MKLIFILVYCFYSFIAFSQNKKSIAVLVLTQENMPLAGAHIFINNKLFFNVTDSTGFIELENLSEGVYSIKVSYIGYTSQENSVSVFNENKVKCVFYLKPNYIQLKEILVRENHKSLGSDLPLIKIYEINKKEIEQMQSPSTLVDVINKVNGVKEVVACGICGTNSISLRGLSGSYTLLLIDDIPVYGSLASIYALNGIPVNIIESVEVTKAASSTLYGSGAIAGVVNVNTLNLDEMPVLSINSNFNSLGTSDVNLASAFKNNKGNFLLGINNYSINNYIDRNNDGFGDVVNINRYSLFSKFSIKRNYKRKFNFFIKYLFEDRRNGVEDYLKNNSHKLLRGNNNVYGESILTKRIELSGIYELPFNSGITTDFSISSHTQDSYYGNNFFYAKQEIFILNAYRIHSVKNNTIKYGLSARLNFYDDNSFLTQYSISDSLINKPITFTLPALFAQNEVRFSEKINFLIGGRIDYYKLHGVIFSPQLNLKFSPISIINIRLHAGTGFNIVNLFAEEHAFVNGQRKLILDKELKPEYSKSISLSTTYFYKLFDNVNNLEIDVYNISFSNKVIPDYSLPGYVVYSNTSNSASSKGLEINISQKYYKNLEFNIGGNIQSAFELIKDNMGKNIKAPIPYSTNYNLQFTQYIYLFKNKLNLNYTWKYTGPTNMPEVFNISNSGNILNQRNMLSASFQQHDIGLKIIYSSKINFSLGIQNLLNFIQPDMPLTGFNDKNYPAGFSPYFDTSYNYAPLIGRRFYMGIKWELSNTKK
jgi:outer membrane receptor for ferrienterochelin and colicins